MADQKRFEAQKLNSEDYQKVEAGAKAVKEGGIVLGALASLVVITKKFGPSLIENLSKVIKV